MKKDTISMTHQRKCPIHLSGCDSFRYTKSLIHQEVATGLNLSSAKQLLAVARPNSVSHYDTDGKAGNWSIQIYINGQ